ncbi:MAG: DUF3300 domain-containing protein [Dechloromonas sp.]|nr:MAG: DUF3300 domain-containing protein [Dechloromonas sp.]
MPSILRGIAALLVAVLLLFAAQARAADPPKFNVEQLDQMLAPIALFPDALLAQVLMATTYPKDVAEAAEWALANRSLQGDDAVKAVQNKPWDPSVQSLVAFRRCSPCSAKSPNGCATWAMPSSASRRRSWTRCNSCAPRPRRPAI